MTICRLLCHHTQLDYQKSLPQFTSIRKAQNNDSYFHCIHLMCFYDDLISIFFLVQPEAPPVIKFCILIERLATVLSALTTDKSAWETHWSVAFIEAPLVEQPQSAVAVLQTILQRCNRLSLNRSTWQLDDRKWHFPAELAYLQFWWPTFISDQK